MSGVVILVLLPQLFPARQAALAAWQRLTWAYGPPTAVRSQYATVTGSWVLYAVWPAVALALALLVVQRRDV